LLSDAIIIILVKADSW